jgi:adenine-specific DNA methylase
LVMFDDAVSKLAVQLSSALPHLPKVTKKCEALLMDSVSKSAIHRRFDIAITSPPYATALPYIDTQRLSLVWLELLSVAELRKLEAELVGSREFSGSARREWARRLSTNADGLAQPLVEFCQRLGNTIAKSDGFRRQAVPHLIYRYLASMLRTFHNTRALLKPHGRFALIIGHNHTVLGGRRVDINTPELLAGAAEQAGFKVAENTELQAYQRFGIHSRNAVARESLLVLNVQ